MIIPTYGEPIYILKRTLAAVILLKYEAGKKRFTYVMMGKGVRLSNYVKIMAFTLSFVQITQMQSRGILIIFYSLHRVN